MTAQGLIVSGSTGPFMVGPPALTGSGAPTSNLKGVLGQNYFDTSTSPRTAYIFTGAEWVLDAQGSGDVNSVTGTANQITASPTTGDVILSIPSTFVAPGTITASTGLTVTAGDVTVTNGNVLINGTGKYLQVQGGVATDFIGTATLAAGTVTVANTNITAADRIFVQRSSINGSTALGVFTYAITPATSFSITALNPTDATTQTNDISIVSYFIVRQV